jgi:hypothetical protein
VPHADLDHPLDFDRINRDMTVEGREWKAPFASVNGGDDLKMIDLNENHQVRVLRGTNPDQLIS